MNASAAQLDQFACLELRGGNDLAPYSAQLPGLSAWVSCNPLRPSRRGGDLYYLSAWSHGSIARVVIADVSGHGAMVSAAAIRFQNALRQYIDLWDQSLLIRDLNESTFSGIRGPRVRYGLFLQLCVGIGRLSLTNAGHMLPLLYRATTQEWSYLQDSTDRRAFRARNLLILYTDGISEAENEVGRTPFVKGSL